ncbi:MAG: TetR/AcrR family transcriptional regulator [Mycobacterium sp.]
MAHPTGTRRERLRREAIDEIKHLAMRQIAESGPAGLSIAAIAKQMGMTGPALYRYFANRDVLLTALIRDGYADLADTMERTARSGAALPASQRLHSVAAELRAWALVEPQRYLLLFGTPVAGYEAPMDTLVAANRTLYVLAAIAAELLPDAPSPTLGALGEQFHTQAVADAVGISATALMAATTTWTRMHGVVSLEVIGQFRHMHIDAGLLLRREIDSVIAYTKSGLSI